MWRLTGETPAGKPFTAKLVILDNADSEFEGYIRWTSAGKPSAIEVFHGKCDSSGQVVIRGFEVLSQRTDVGIGTYRATYDAKKQEFVEGIAEPLATGRVAGYFSASHEADVPASLPKLMNLPRSEGDWPTLCRNLSNGFARGRIGHRHFSNPRELDELIASDDDRLRMMSRLRNGQEVLNQFRNDKKNGNLSEEDASHVAAAKEILKETFPIDSDAGNKLPADLMMLVHTASQSRGGKHADNDKLAMRALEGLIADALRKQLIAAASPMRNRSEMRASDIRARCRPANGGGLVARITNKSGKNLHRCLIVTQFSVDPQALAVASQRKTEQTLAAAAVSKWLGLKAKSRRGASRKLDYYWAYESLDKGSICYLEVWPDGRTIDVDLAPAPCHCIDGTKARVYVFSPNGSIDVSIDQPSLRIAFAESRLKSKSTFVSKPKKKAKRSRRRAPT